jgi:hypothetical protein
MAITMAHLTANFDTTNRLSTNYVTADISFVAGRTYLIAVRARTSAGSPELTSITGGGNTFAVPQTANVAGITLFFGWVVAGSTTTAPITIDPGGANQWTAASWIVDEVSGAHATTPIVQSAQANEPAAHTALAVTLAAFADATNNAAWSAAQINSDARSLTREAGYTALGDILNTTENVNQLISFWKLGQDTSVESTNSSTTDDSIAVAIEIAAAAQPPGYARLSDSGTSATLSDSAVYSATLSDAELWTVEVSDVRS